jgi:glycosyltransferase involved in cell wall biosynthesis
MVFISDFTKDDYSKFYGNLSTKKYATIPIGIDTIETPLEIQNQLMERWSLSGKRIVLNVGSEDPRKNIKIFLELARHYKDTPDMIFIRVGRKSEESTIYIDQYDLDNVLYVSGLSEEELMGLYKISTIVVSPSLLEGYGKQIFEGYLYNNFVISTQVSDVASLFKGDPCVFMIHDPLSLHEYVQAIDTICKNNLTFHSSTKIQSLEKEAQEYLDFLQSV